MAVVTIYSDFGAPQNKVSLFPHLFAMKWWDWMPWSSFFFNLSFMYLFIYFYFIVLVLPYIDMNPPWVYMCVEF